MSIRTRLTAWYVGILFLGLILVAGWTYYEMFVEHRIPGTGDIELPPGETPLEEVGEIMLYGGLPAMLVALCGGWLLIHRALAPVTRLTRAIEHIHAGNLHKHLPTAGQDDEILRLTEVFNDMTGRLHDSFRRIQEFTLHASHELKTPLTVMQAALETALSDGVLSGEQRDRIGIQLEEVRRLSRIVDELALLTKADAGLVVFGREPLDLDALLREAFEDAQILARERRIEVELTECEAVRVEGDRNRLRQLLLNVCDNAIKYNRPDGQVRMSLRRVEDRARIEIVNTGAGLAPALEGRVFERFFRGDPSHCNDVEGCGLGLSIAQCIVRLHGGWIRFRSEPRMETTVTIELPAFAATHAPSVRGRRCGVAGTGARTNLAEIAG